MGKKKTEQTRPDQMELETGQDYIRPAQSWPDQNG